MVATLLLTGVLGLLGAVAAYAVGRGLQWFLAVVTGYPKPYELTRTSAGRPVAATGSPAALASALETLTDADWPVRNPRVRSAVSAFAIVPEEPPEPIRLKPDGEQAPAFADAGRQCTGSSGYIRRWSVASTR